METLCRDSLLVLWVGGLDICCDTDRSPQGSVYGGQLVHQEKPQQAMKATQLAYKACHWLQHVNDSVVWEKRGDQVEPLVLLALPCSKEYSGCWATALWSPSNSSAAWLTAWATSHTSALPPPPLSPASSL